METKESVMEILEGLVDRHGLLHVLAGLEIVCGDKAEHIVHAWQDRATANPWYAAATIVGNAARKVDV